MGILSLLGIRNRGFLDSSQNRKVLEMVGDGLRVRKVSNTPFSLRENVAAALKECGFDDRGVGCRQEINVINLVAQALRLPQDKPEYVETFCKDLANEAIRVALRDAARYA